MKYFHLLLALVVSLGGGFIGSSLYQAATFGSLSLPTSTQEATTTGWADDGTVVRLDTSSDNVGIGSTSPSERLGLAGSIFAEESSGTTTLNLGAVGTGVGSGIQLKTTSGQVICIYATTTPVLTSAVTSGLAAAAGPCQ